MPFALGGSAHGSIRVLDKASPVLDLYQGLWKGEPLGPDDFVISADEKPGIQALERIQAPRPAISGHPAHFEHEYRRHGTQAYLAALDIQSGRVFGQVHDKTGIRPFMSFVDHVMRRKPYRTARRVFWIVDNGASHQPSTFPERLRRRYPNAIAVHLPIHASWLNQVEIYFSIIQRKLIRRGHFPSQQALKYSILDFQYHYNRTAEPFHWSFTAAELRDRLILYELMNQTTGSLSEYYLIPFYNTRDSVGVYLSAVSLVWRSVSIGLLGQAPKSCHGDRRDARGIVRRD